MKNYCSLIIFILIIISCKEPIDYQFKNSPKTVDCSGINYELAHDAYYSFRQDIAIYVKNLRIGYNNLNYQESLGYFIYRGAQGNFDFREMVTPHTRKLLTLLKKNEDLWDTTSEKSNLNYHSEFVSCLVENIKNEDIKTTLQALIKTNTMNSSIFAENYRANVFDCNTDNHFGMLLAFDTYYQHLYQMKF